MAGQLSVRLRRHRSGKGLAIGARGMHQPQRLLSLRRIEIPSDRYQADLELHDRFLQFSGELLRMALGGIVAIGFFLSLLAGKGPLPATLFRVAVYAPLTCSVVAFVLAGGCALAHRFLAADGMFYHLRAIKHLLLVEAGRPHADLVGKRDEILAAAGCDEDRRNRKFRSSERILFVSAALLFVGVAALGSGVVAVLLGGPARSAQAGEVRVTSER